MNKTNDPIRQGLERGVVADWIPSVRRRGDSLYDFSGRRQHAATVGSPTWSTDTPPGGAGSLGLNGTNQYADSVLIWNSTGPITWAFWTKTDETLLGSTQNGIGGAVDASNRLMAHTPFFNSTLYFDYGNTTTGRLSVAWPASLNNKWTHITLLSAGAAGALMQIYLNGELAATKAASDGPTGAISFDVGHGDVPGVQEYFHKGNLGRMRLYDRVLSAIEVRALYYEWQRRPRVETSRVMPGVEVALPVAQDGFVRRAGNAVHFRRRTGNAQLFVARER